MDFFARQDAARKKTKWLVVYFTMAVVATILAIYIAVLVVFSGVQSQQKNHRDEQPPLVLWNPQLFLGIAFGTIFVILCGSAYKIMALSAGGSAVSEMMGARPVSTS